MMLSGFLLFCCDAEKSVAFVSTLFECAAMQFDANDWAKSEYSQTQPPCLYFFLSAVPQKNKYLPSYLHSPPFPSEQYNYSKYHLLQSQWLFWIGDVSSPTSFNSQGFFNLLNSVLMGIKLLQWLRLQLHVCFNNKSLPISSEPRFEGFRVLSFWGKHSALFLSVLFSDDEKVRQNTGIFWIQEKLKAKRTRIKQKAV